MNQKITISKAKTDRGWKFEVEVADKESTTNHSVTMTEKFYEGLNIQEDPEEIVQKSFQFLLERESKEMILSEFDISVISDYFPEYKRILQSKI